MSALLDYVIWKYPLQLIDQQQITVRGHNARPLHVGLDGSRELCLWCACQPNMPEYALTVHIVGTGRSIPRDLIVNNCYAGSVTQNAYVWHVFVSE